MSNELPRGAGLFKSQATLIPTFSLKGRRGKFPRPYWGEAIARRLCGILPRYGRASGVRGNVKRLLKSRAARGCILFWARRETHRRAF